MGEARQLRLDQIRRREEEPASGGKEGNGHRSSNHVWNASYVECGAHGAIARKSGTVNARSTAAVRPASCITNGEQKQVERSHGSFGPEGFCPSQGQSSHGSAGLRPAIPAARSGAIATVDARQTAGHPTVRKSAR